jgi:hypothetical protein
MPSGHIETAEDRAQGRRPPAAIQTSRWQALITDTGRESYAIASAVTVPIAEAAAAAEKLTARDSAIILRSGIEPKQKLKSSVDSGKMSDNE